ncbi:hypothetical protein JCM8115_001317 [Rhodotorula mucilaginosa]|nr:hypothetical protein B0A53_00518 [Rhodotorula sp. CCFEE 5036]
MQFARSKRFPTPPPDSVPPPGAYDVPVHSPVQPYKRAGMIEKANRFGTLHDPNKPDTFGLYNTDPTLAAADKENGGTLAKSTRSGHAQIDREKHKRDLEDLRLRLTAAHEKDLAKLHSKLAKLEQTKADYKKDRDESTKERDGLKSEIRHLTSKLGKTTALLEKHQSALPSLQSKLEAMSASHAASAARKDAELATTRGRLSELEKRLAAEIERRQGVEEERDQWERRARRERQGREEAATAAGEAVRAVRAAADERDTERLVELHADRTAHVRLERQLADRKAQVESLAAYASTLEARLSLAEEDRARSDRDQRFVLLEAWHAERDLNAPLTSGQSGGGRAEVEKEWRQRARADAREVEGLREEVALAQIEEEVLSALHGETLRWEHEREKSWKADRAAAKKALQATEHELDEAINTEIPRLEGLLASSEASLETTRTELATAHEHISTLESDLAEIQQRLVDETDRLEGQVEEQKRLLSEGRKELDKERGEKRRVVGILAQTRASEAALKEEVESLTREVDHLTPLLAETDALHQTVDHLARLNAASEAEAQQLIAQNTELVGHSNQGQKIRHVAMMREELAESRKKHLATLSSLTAAQQKISNLEAELDTYRAVPTSGGGGGGSGVATRARVTRPTMDDAYSSTVPTQTPTVVVSSSSSAPTAAPAITSGPSLAPPLAGGIARRASLVRSGSGSTTATTTATSDNPLTSVSVAFADDLAPLLPPQLAKSQPATLAPPTLRGGAAAGAKSVGAAAGAKGGGGGRRGAGGPRRESMGVKMEGRMSVSELF